MGFTRYIPIITFIVYSILLVYLLYTQNTLLAKTLYKPLASFLIVTLLRKVINRKRPYEAMAIDPLIEHKQGESFPSRHTVSAFAIALACLQVNSLLGTIMLILAFVVSCSRILSGVHYISDVQLPVDTNLDNPLNQSILTKQVLVYINNKSWIKEID